MENINLIAVILTLVMVLVGTPILLIRVDYPWNKVAFGTVVVLLVALALIAMLSTIQTKAGLGFPLLWLAPLATGFFGVVAQKRLLPQAH